MSQSRLFKNITLLSIVQIANYVFPLITVPIISRIIGPEKYGILNYAFTFISYFTILITYGFDLTATRRIAKDPTNIVLRNKVFSEVFSAQLILFVLSVVIFIPCVFFISPLAVDRRVSVLTFLMCVGTLFTQNWMFQAMQNLSTVAILNFIGKLLGALSVLMLVHNVEDYYWQAFSTSMSSICVAICSFFLSIKRYNIKFERVSFIKIFRLLNNEKTVFISIVVISLYTFTNTVMLGIQRSSIEVGFYTAGQRLIIVLSSIVNYPIYQAFFPFVGAAFGISRQNGIDILQKSSAIIISLMLIICITIFLSAPFIVEMFYGSAFSSSVLVVRTLSFIPLATGISSILGIQTMLNLNMDKQYLYISLGGAFLGLVLNYFMIQSYGYIGAAINWIIVECYISISMFIFLRSRGIYPISLSQFKPALIITSLHDFKRKKFKPEI